MVEPHTSVLWSEFVADGEAASNISSGLPVVIPCGHEVTFDKSVHGLGGLQVMGSVKFQDDIDIHLETDHVLVCGRFSIGSPADPHGSKVEIVLTGSTDLTWPATGGAKNFGKAPFVTYGGTLYIRGSACGTTTWTRLSRSIGPAQVDHENIARGQAAAQSSIGHQIYSRQGCGRQQQLEVGFYADEAGGEALVVRPRGRSVGVWHWKGDHNEALEVWHRSPVSDRGGRRRCLSGRGLVRWHHVQSQRAARQ